MPRSPRPHSPTALTLGWASILAPLGLGFALSVALAWHAWDASRSHLAAARSTTRDQAQFAAHLLATAVDRRLREALTFGFYPVDLAMGRGRGPLPHPRILRAEPELSRCPESEGLPDRHLFRYEPRGGGVLVDGPAPDHFAPWVRQALASQPLNDSLPFRHVPAPDGDWTRPVVFRTWVHDGQPVVYGFESCWRTAAGDAFREAVARTQAFAPTLVGDTPNDSLFRLTVRAPDGSVVVGGDRRRASGPQDYAAFYGNAVLAPADAYGGVTLRVTLLPEVAEQLVEGGMPRSRLPLALGLLVLNGVLMWTAIRQLRRGQELVETRTRFVRNVSHELRTPLQQILLFAELLRSRRLSAPEERERALDVLLAETRRLIDLVGNVLQFSRSAGGEVRLGAVELAHVVEDAVEGFRPLARGRRAEVDVRVDGRPLVRGDAQAIRRIVTNLLDNAVKYGPEGQRVTVAVTSDGFSISDEGPGIPPAHREEIWEAFRRLERDEDGATAGSGIGLAIVQRLTMAMGGTVTVDNAPGGGARFRVRLLPSEDGP